MAKLIVTYVSSGNKQEVLNLMARMLNFTEEEMQKVGLGVKKGWIPFLRGSSGVPQQQRSVGDLWMEFLLKEVGDEAKGKAAEDKPKDENENPKEPESKNVVSL